MMLPVALFPSAALCEDCKKQQICEYGASGTYNCTCAPGYYGDKCEGIVHSPRFEAYLQAAEQVASSRLGYLKRSCAIPQEFGALPWKRLLWWWIIVIIKTDTASPSLLREPGNASRLMLWIIVLQRFFISLPTRGSALSRLKKASLWVKASLWYSGHFFRQSCWNMHASTHCYLLLWKLAIAPHYSFKHSCCLHNHSAIWTQNTYNAIMLTFLSRMLMKSLCIIFNVCVIFCLI